MMNWVRDDVNVISFSFNRVNYYPFLFSSKSSQSLETFRQFFSEWSVIRGIFIGSIHTGSDVSMYTQKVTSGAAPPQFVWLHELAVSIRILG